MQSQLQTSQQQLQATINNQNRLQAQFNTELQARINADQQCLNLQSQLQTSQQQLQATINNQNRLQAQFNTELQARINADQQCSNLQDQLRQSQALHTGLEVSFLPSVTSIKHSY